MSPSELGDMLSEDHLEQIFEGKLKSWPTYTIASPVKDSGDRYISPCIASTL